MGGFLGDQFGIAQISGSNVDERRRDRSALAQGGDGRHIAALGLQLQPFDKTSRLCRALISVRVFAMSRRIWASLALTVSRTRFRKARRHILLGTIKMKQIRCRLFVTLDEAKRFKNLDRPAGRPKSTASPPAKRPRGRPRKSL
jgi:hypothetical protein